MWNQIDPKTNNDHFIIYLMAERRGDDRSAFFQEISKVILKTDSPMEVAQEAFKLIQTEEQMEQMLEFIGQQKLERSKA